MDPPEPVRTCTGDGRPNAIKVTGISPPQAEKVTTIRIVGCVLLEAQLSSPDLCSELAGSLSDT